jgi:hypothetical protein
MIRKRYLEARKPHAGRLEFEKVPKEHLMRNLICKLFHRLSWPRQDEQGYYQVCLSDGRHIPWHDPLPLLSPYRIGDFSVGNTLTFSHLKKPKNDSTQVLSTGRIVADVLR